MRSLAQKRAITAWSFLAPMLVVLALVAGWPLLRTILLGFHRTNLESLRALDPALRVQAIASDPADVARMRTWADGINLPASLATPDLVSSLRADGVSVLGRRTSARSDWSRLRRAGAEGVLTDRVASYVSWSRTVPAS